MVFAADAILAGFLVGVLVGMTGVGGGALMAPVLLLLFKLNPLIVVGTDLFYSGRRRDCLPGIRQISRIEPAFGSKSTRFERGGYGIVRI
jgi:hypothetical protein